MNTLRTGFLMIVLSVLLVMAGYFMHGPGGMILAMVFSLGINFFACWYSDKLALRMAGAKEVSQEEAPDLHFIVGEQARLGRLPKPRVYLIENDSPNAFATDRNPSHAAVAATAGIMRILNRDELSAVLAHEMAHLGNRDNLIHDDGRCHRRSDYLSRHDGPLVHDLRRSGRRSEGWERGGACQE